MARGLRLLLGAVLALALCGAVARAYARELGDVVYSRTKGAEQYPPAYFPHWVHRLRYRCYACHDDLFAMRGAPTPTMAAMARGESCGACHNGKTAFAVDTCQRCHVQQ